MSYAVPISIVRRKLRIRITFRPCVLALLLCVAGMPAAVRSQDSSQNKEGDDAQALLQHAWDVMGGTQAATMLIHYHAVASLSQNFQSDRMYPPFLEFFQEQESWFSRQSAVERSVVRSSYPLSKPQTSVLLTDASRAFSVSDTGLQALSRDALLPRDLNPWLVISDWRKEAAARAVGVEMYRDFPRIVVTRLTREGEQRLFLDPKSGFPVKLEFNEKHYLWGQRRLEFLYTTWVSTRGVAMPGASYLLADGVQEISQTLGDLEVTGASDAPSLDLPAEPSRSEDTLPLFLQPLPLNVTEIGPATFLLANPGYREVVAKVGDEVFLLDATQGEQRAREDEEQIAKLFPGKHKITVVITDLAWPHVSGLRYWVASGATIIAHKTARDFLQSVIDRKWTAAPDFLEEHRKTAKLKFIGVDGLYQLAGGALTLYPINGIGSEGALMAFLPADRFLWASDFIQTVSEPSQYCSEVWKAVQRERLRPERTAAEHLNITPWSEIEKLQIAPKPAK